MVHEKRRTENSAPKTAHQKRRAKNGARKRRAKNGLRKASRQKWRTGNIAPKMAHEIECLLMGHITKNLARQKKRQIRG